MLIKLSSLQMCLIYTIDHRLILINYPYSSQKIIDFMRDTISGKISLKMGSHKCKCKKRSRFAAAVEEDNSCIGCTKTPPVHKYNISIHDNETIIDSCKVLGCSAPVVFPCSEKHTMCHTCILEMIKITTPGITYIKCPFCRAQHSILPSESSESPSSARGAPLSSRGAPLSSLGALSSARGAPSSARGAPSNDTWEDFRQVYGTGFVGMLLSVYAYGIIILLIFGISELISKNM